MGIYNRKSNVNNQKNKNLINYISNLHLNKQQNNIH